MVTIDQEKCTSCGLCVADCPTRIIELREGTAVINKGRCIRCAHCFAICPVNAVTIDGYDLSESEELAGSLPRLDPGELMKALKSRRSIRQYKKEVPSREEIERIIEAGRYTPTASNGQNVSYLVVEKNLAFLEEETLKIYRNFKKIAKPIHRIIRLPVDPNKVILEPGYLFRGAPLVILTISPSFSNGSLAAMSMELMAEAMGLGVVYVGLFSLVADRSRKIRSILGVKKNERIVQCLALGYPDVKYQRTAPRNKAKIEWR